MASILVIDDERDVREALASALTRMGHSVRVAADGPAGIEACRAAPVDLVITDLVMPRAHGFDVIGQLRADYPQLRFVAISGGGNFAAESYEPDAVTTTAYLAAAREFGAVAVLSKPFSRAELLRAINEALGLA